MKLKEIPRAATFAWSPQAQQPTVITGTAAGTIDADFDASSTLELWELDLQDHSIGSFTAAPTHTQEADARFHSLAVNNSGEVVVGALESGAISAWNARNLAPLGQNAQAHVGAARTVDFSRHDDAKFATGGENGQVLVWNVNDLANPVAPASNGTGNARPASALAGASGAGSDVVQSVQWNTGTQYILASGGSNGFARIWDTRRHREVLNLHYTTPSGGIAPLSCVQWHPNHSTKLATAALDDAEPVILIWDMKNVNKPEQVLRGHHRGVLSLDWCRQDSGLMLSGGRDNETLLWNPERGTQLGAYPMSVEWVFKTQFHPKLPDLFATASFDGKVSVQTLQDTTPQAAAAGSAAAGKAAATANENDFWESETVLDAVHPSFSLMQPPKWLQRPVSAKFGFGGKLAVAANGKLAVHAVRDPTLDEEKTAKLKHALETHDFSAISSSWDPVLQNLLEKDEVSLPTSSSKNDGKEGEENEDEDEDEDEDDEFLIAPQYQPSGSFDLLGSDIARLILKNNFDEAVTKLIARDQPSDALLVASFGPPELVARAQNAYLSANAERGAHLRTAWAVANRNFTDLIMNAELDAWPDVLRAVMAAKDPALTSKASLAIAKRLEASGQVEDALRAVLAGRNVSAAAALWLDELPQIESRLSEETTAFGVRVKALQQVVEKIAAACSKLGLPKADEPGSERLFAAFRDYADLASQQGDLKLAMLFLNMLPSEFAADKHRVERASTSPQKKAAKANAAVNAAPNANVGGPALGAIPPFTPSIPTVPASTSPESLVGGAPSFGRTRPAVRPATGIRAQRAVPTSVSPSRPVVIPTPAPPGSMTAPALASIQKSQQQQQQQTAAGAASGSTTSTTAPPPPAAAAGAAGAHSRLAEPFKGWNDVPELPIQPRRSRVAPAKVAAPPRQPSVSAPPVTGSPRASVSHAQQQAQVAAPPPPPPKAPNPYGSKHGVVRSVSNSSSSSYVPAAAPASAAPSPHSTPAPPRPFSRNQPVRVPSASQMRAPPAAAAAAAAPVPPPAAAAPPVARPPPPAAGAAASARASPVPPPAAVAPPVAASSVPPPAAAAAAAPPAAPATPEPSVSVTESPAEAIFTAELARIQKVIEPQYPKQYKDTQRRLQLLHEQIPQLSEDVLAAVESVASMLAERKYVEALEECKAIGTAHQESSKAWLTGVQRLIKMSQGVPV